MKKVLPPVVAVLLLALTAAVAVQFQRNAALAGELRDAQGQLATTKGSLAEKDQEIQRLRDAQATFQAEAKALRERLSSAPEIADRAGDKASPTASSPAPAETSGKPASMTQQWAKMFKDPEMKKMMRTQQSFGIRMMYGDLATELGLSAEETDQLNELLTDRQLAMSESGLEAMSGNLDPKKMAELGEAAKKSGEEYDKEVANVLGSDRYAKFKEYEKSIGERVMLRQYHDQLAARGTPLQESQRQQLLAIMTEERLKAPASPFDANGRNPAAMMEAMRSEELIGKQFEKQKQINARVLERAAGLLSPEQVNSLRASQEQMLEMQQMGLKMSREMFGKQK